ncbi:hypothetical protein SEPCBS119000_006437 [Sporothrix epigloea]|uniref:Amino acid permease/ SLC12A domain-containing protein n=1 Tax=Sporothrix epigloea TaxID=1892477 RepID=A0ABP0E765_9PEZI
MDSAIEKSELKAARPASMEPTSDVDEGSAIPITAGSQSLHRNLRGKEVQLFAIGGAIGTFNECFAEMVTLVPVPSPFVRFGSEWVDGALGFGMAWNFFLNMAFLVPFEIVAFQIMLTFWTDSVPVEATIVALIVLYGLLNVISVRYFGIAEFYLSIFKVVLMVGLFFFTFITMLGGNPIHDRYGFRYWKNPGAFVSHLEPGSVGRLCGIISCIYQASFSICGPEYISMVASEAESPRKVLPPAFRSFIYRILFFFVGSAFCMGIVIPYNDATLAAILGGATGGSGTGAASPYVIAMQRMHIKFLPHLVNAMIMTSVFSAGNGLLFSATRTLHGMALEGHAPRFFGRCTKAGVPVYALALSLAFCLLAFLQVSSSSADVLTYIVDLVTCCQIINYLSTAVTYRHFYSALQKQGVDRKTLPYKGRLQPYTSYYAMFGLTFMMLAAGYDLFLSGGWSTMWFFLDYGMIFFFIVLVVIWKIVTRSTYIRPGEADISLGGLKEEIDRYEELYLPHKSATVAGRYFNKLFE